MVARNTVAREKFNPKAVLPYELRYEDFALAMQDIYDFFSDVNELLISKGLTRLDQHAQTGQHVQECSRTC